MQAKKTGGPSPEQIEVAVFMVGDLICGLDIAEVREINKDLDLTYVDKAPDYVAGIINLRGHIVSIIDLRQRLELSAVETNDKRRNVIVYDGEEQIGLIVDDVDDIISVATDKVSPPPPNMDEKLGRFVNGVVQRGQDLVLLLDVTRLTQVDNQSLAGAGATTS